MVTTNTLKTEHKHEKFTMCENWNISNPYFILLILKFSLQKYLCDLKFTNHNLFLKKQIKMARKQDMVKRFHKPLFKDLKVKKQTKIVLKMSKSKCT